MDIAAKAKFVKTTPDKIRILSHLVVNKNPQTAISQLTFSGREASKYIVLVIKQAIDQVKTKGLDINNFKIKSFIVNEGPKLKRRRIQHQGRATTILKRMAHISIILTDDKSEALNSKLEISGKKPKFERNNGAKS